jgi:hypothetical protein
VLTATGVQSEAELPFAGLHQLLRPLPWNTETLPDPQKEALLAAFGRSRMSVPDPFLIALAALELLTDAATRSPLLVLAEDAQWLGSRPAIGRCDSARWTPVDRTARERFQCTVRRSARDNACGTSRRGVG